MSEPGYMIALGECFGCKTWFGFNPHRVPSIPIDPQTHKPPDVDPEPGGYQRAQREPLCRDCVRRMNAARRARGLAPIEILPDAYGPEGA
jgi:hypothetical protein